MKSMERLLLVLVPLLALTAFFVVRKQYGEIAPAPPAAVEQDENTPLAVVRPTQQQPTVLEARAMDAGESLPPGIDPIPTMTPQASDDVDSSHPIILIPNPETTLAPTNE